MVKSSLQNCPVARPFEGVKIELSLEEIIKGINLPEEIGVTMMKSNRLKTTPHFENKPTRHGAQPRNRISFMVNVNINVNIGPTLLRWILTPLKRIVSCF